MLDYLIQECLLTLSSIYNFFCSVLSPLKYVVVFIYYYFKKWLIFFLYQLFLFFYRTSIVLNDFFLNCIFLHIKKIGSIYSSSLILWVLKFVNWLFVFIPVNKKLNKKLGELWSWFLCMCISVEIWCLTMLLNSLFFIINDLNINTGKDSFNFKMVKVHLFKFFIFFLVCVKKLKLYVNWVIVYFKKRTLFSLRVVWAELVFFELIIWLILGFTIICGPDSIFDLSDFNCSAVMWLSIVVLVIILDNWVKSRDGQLVSKDRVLLFLTSSYWVTFDFYLRVIVIVFCFHCLIPLEADFFELYTLYISVMNWYTIWLCSILIIFFLLFVFILIINININWFGYIWGKFVFGSGCVLILFIFAMITWGLLFNSYSGYSFFANDTLFYQQSRNNFVYNSSLLVYDNFDWHMDQNFDFSIRFEQLYMFCFQFFNICILWNCLFLFIYTWGYSLFVSHEVLSYKYFINGFILIWWENCGWWLYSGFLSYLLVGCRLLLTQTVEHNFWLIS